MIVGNSMALGILNKMEKSLPSSISDGNTTQYTLKIDYGIFAYQPKMFKELVINLVSNNKTLKKYATS